MWVKHKILQNALRRELSNDAKRLTLADTTRAELRQEADIREKPLTAARGGGPGPP